jgi:hypothetical protein
MMNDEQPFLIWKMEIQWENGLGGSGGSERIFLFFCLKFAHLDLKNPFQSARSAQSVLPLYLPFPNEKLLNDE